MKRSTTYPIPGLSRRVSLRLLLTCIALLCSLVLPACAQEFRGTITGLVTDSAGAVVPHALVVASGPQQSYNARTGADGDFTIPLVQPGVYTVSVTAPGFKKVEQPGIIVDVTGKVNLPFTCLLGRHGVSESVRLSRRGGNECREQQ